MTSPSSGAPEPAPLRVDTLPALQLAQSHLGSQDPALKAAAETVMSYLVLHLRSPQCVIPVEAVPALRRLLTHKPTK